MTHLEQRARLCVTEEISVTFGVTLRMQIMILSGGVRECKLGLLFTLLWSIIKTLLWRLEMEISWKEAVNCEGLGHYEDRCSLTQINSLKHSPCAHRHTYSCSDAHTERHTRICTWPTVCCSADVFMQSTPQSVWRAPDGDQTTNPGGACVFPDALNYTSVLSPRSSSNHLSAPHNMSRERHLCTAHRMNHHQFSVSTEGWQRAGTSQLDARITWWNLFGFGTSKKTAE